MLANNLSWKVSWTCNNTNTIKTAVEAGLGISVISRRSVKNEAGSGKILIKEIEGMTFQRKFKIVYHKNKFLTGTMKDFIHLCINTGA
jgi:DNA-binding transcriptional LysR family regulator